jgi:chemotaxis signal transduction protein
MEPDDVLRRRAAALARKPVERDIGARSRALVAVIGAQRYAFPIEHVLRVLSVGRCTPVPNAPPGIVGVAKLEGKIVAVFGGRTWRGLPEAVHADSPVVVLGTRDSPLVLLVDSVDGTIDVPEDVRDLRDAGEPWLRAIVDDVLLVVVPRLIELLAEQRTPREQGPR